MRKVRPQYGRADRGVISASAEDPMIRTSWKDRYNSNYKEIDDQRKGLLDILDERADLHRLKVVI